MIAGFARHLRGLARQSEPSFSTTAIASACFPAVLITGQELPDGVHETVYMDPTGPVIFYQRGLPSSQQRLAIAHAFAHLLFDVEGDKVANEDNCGDSAVELRADEFAAELLAPAKLVAKSFPEHLLDRPNDDDAVLDVIDGISSKFNVPRWVIRAQLSKT